MTIRESLQALNAYPIPSKVIEDVAIKRGLTLTANMTITTAGRNDYLLATADLYKYLSTAPNVSQGGQSYSFDSTQRADFLAIAHRIYNDYGNASDKVANKSIFGYKGHRL